MTTSASKMQPAKMLMGMILLVSQASASSMKTIITNDATLAARTVEARQAGADITTLKFGNLAGSFAMTQVEALKTLDHPLATVTTIETTVAGKSVSTVLPLIVGPSGWIWSAIPDADMSYPYWPVPTAPTGPRMCLVHDGCGSPPVATTAITTAHPSTETGAAKQWTCVECSGIMCPPEEEESEGLCACTEKTTMESKTLAKGKNGCDASCNGCKP